MRNRSILLRYGGALAAVVLLAGAAVFAKNVAEEARLVAPHATPILYDRNGVFLSEIGFETRGETSSERRIDYGYWPLDKKMPDRVVRATLALEDRRFWDHPGVDLFAIGRALWQNLGGGRGRSGASTLAMQIARMQHPAERSYLPRPARRRPHWR